MNNKVKVLLTRGNGMVGKNILEYSESKKWNILLIVPITFEKNGSQTIFLESNVI